MRTSVIAAATLTLLAAAAQAQQAPLTQTSPPVTQANPTLPMQEVKGAWHASDFMNSRVYNMAGESMGEVSDLVLDESGKVTAVIVGVGTIDGVGAVVAHWRYCPPRAPDVTPTGPAHTPAQNAPTKRERCTMAERSRHRAWHLSTNPPAGSGSFGTDASRPRYADRVGRSAGHDRRRARRRPWTPVAPARSRRRSA